jgi:hypothetical protein
MLTFLKTTTLFEVETMKKIVKSSVILFSTLAISTGAYAKVDVSQDVEIFSEKTKDPEALTVSPDGKTLFWIARKSQTTKLEAIDAWYSDTTNINETKINRPFLNIYTMASYGGEDKMIIDHEYGRFVALMKTLYAKYVQKKDEPVGYKSCIDILDIKTSKVEKKLCPKDLGLENDELVAHARMSPDHNWITFYIKGTSSPAGIYLYNLNNQKVFFLGEHNDKHPTWTNDGKKILFHFQRGGNVKDNDTVEQSYIGYYDVELDSEKLISSNRHLLDNPDEKTTYTYQKHPVLIGGTNLVIYHGQEKADGSKKLFIRKLKEGSKEHELSFNYNACKIKSMKHPSIGFEDHYLYFVGKVECKDVKSEAKILRMDTGTIVDSMKKD